MNITSKTQYGLKAMLDIVYHHRVGPVQRRHIAARQGIPTDYMDQILMRLRNGGFIHSLRGREGGYHLALEPHEITVWDIVCAVEDQPYTVDSPRIDPECSYATGLITDPAWLEVERRIEESLRGKTLEDYLNDAEERLMQEGLDPVELMEAKPSRDWKLGPKMALA
jgi:Rrf2 family protein